METQLIIANIYALIRHVYAVQEFMHEVSITPRRDRWHVLVMIKRSAEKPHVFRAEGGNLNEALLTMLTRLMTAAFPHDLEA